MGKRGPKKMPTEIKLHRGNPGKENLAAQLAREPKPGEASLVAPPMLDGNALEMWNLRAPQLAAMKVFTDADRVTLQRYCIAWELYVLAFAELKANGLSREIGSGRRVQLPEANLVSRYHADLLAIEREFGLTPSSRTGVRVENAETQDDLRAFIEGTA
jgi:P27 family predicted phage terminase small subunit